MVMKLQAFTTHNLRQHPQFWSQDIDRNPSESLLRLLSFHTRTPLSDCRATTLVSYTGNLWPEYSPFSTNWVMPVGKHGRYRINHGHQYCRLCLATDAEPYFRKSWRLAFNTACLTHNIYLRDSCPNCNSPIQYHVNDFGLKQVTGTCLITLCNRCGFDLKEVGPAADIPAHPDILDLQRWLNKLLAQGFGTIEGLYSYNSVLIFTGLKTLLRPLSSTTRLNRIKPAILNAYGELDLNGYSSLRTKFETSRVSERVWDMLCLYQLLIHWPTNFIKLFKQYRISSSYLKDYRNTYPYWLTKEIEWELNDLDYSPSQEERMSATRFLENHDYPVNQSNINLLIGTSAVSQRAKMKRDRWNPRGGR